MTSGAPDWVELARHIGQVTGDPFAPSERRAVGGGCINTAVILSQGPRAYFVKYNATSRLDQFDAECDGLAALGASGAIRVPAPVCCGASGNAAYLVLECLDLRQATSRAGAAAAGQALAALHRSTGAGFGWRRDNYIGATPQPNGQQADWTAFWRDQRLGFQLVLARRNGFGGSLDGPGEALLAALPALLDHHPAPSLLHGDLWGGNLGYLPDGTPTIFDPAVYLGDREADLAMTELFGGFGADFYAAYRESWPLDPGFATRKTLYNLYHILNHLNLFGASYLGQARDMMGRLLAATR